MADGGSGGLSGATDPRLSARQLARVGERIRTLRASVSLRALADRTGLSPGTISQIENGHHEPRLGTLLALQSAFGAGSLDELIGEMPSALLRDLEGVDPVT